MKNAKQNDIQYMQRNNERNKAKQSNKVLLWYDQRKNRIEAV